MIRGGSKCEKQCKGFKGDKNLAKKEGADEKTDYFNFY